MDNQQANQFLMDYGPLIWFIFLTIVSIAALVKMWPFISSVVKTVEIITELPERFQHIDKKLDTLEMRLINVEQEVKTNGGASLKDAIKRVEDRLDTL